MVLTQLITEGRRLLAERRKRRKPPGKNFHTQDLTKKDVSYLMGMLANNAGGAANVRIPSGKPKEGWEVTVQVKQTDKTTLRDMEDIIDVLREVGFHVDWDGPWQEKKWNRKGAVDRWWELEVYGRPLRPIAGEKTEDFMQRAFAFYVTPKLKPRKSKYGWTWAISSWEAKKLYVSESDLTEFCRIMNEVTSASARWYLDPEDDYYYVEV